MAITVKDIHEKEFSKASRGYSIEEVDDFLDALAAQQEQMLREAGDMKAALANAQAQAKAARDDAEIARKALDMTLAEAEAAKKEAEEAQAEASEDELNAAPPFNEPSYFKNLETTLRETLISAQRIADETIDEAQKQARTIVSEAEAQAAKIRDESVISAAQAKVEYETLKNASREYKRGFSELIEAQTKLLSESALFE